MDLYFGYIYKELQNFIYYDLIILLSKEFGNKKSIFIFTFCKNSFYLIYVDVLQGYHSAFLETVELKIRKMTIFTFRNMKINTIFQPAVTKPGQNFNHLGKFYLKLGLRIFKDFAFSKMFFFQFGLIFWTWQLRCFYLQVRIDVSSD